MPNNITNVIELKGNKEEVEKLVNKFSKKYHRKPKKIHDESMIICHNDSGFCGWYNEADDLFEFSNNRGVKVSGLPKGVKYEYTEEWLQFPDFEKVITMPKHIEKTIGSFGCNPPWYNWRVDNWGTKWNSYKCQRIDKNIFKFETAWCGVVNIIKEISCNFPSIEIIYKYADEDTSYNIGSFIYKNGEILSDFSPEEGTKEAYELYFELKPNNKKHYKLIDGKYEYIDEE